MRSFLLTAVLLIAAAVATTVPASAETRHGAMSEHTMRHRYDGPRMARDRDENRSHGRRLARAVYSDVYDSDDDDDDRDDYSARRHRSQARHHHRARRAHHAQHRRGHTHRHATRHHGKRHATRHHTGKSRHARRHAHHGRYAERRAHSRHERRTARRHGPAWTRHVLGYSHGGGRTGIASYYWQGQRVASGGRFNPDGMTAAHRTLPFGTRVRVTHMGNGRSVTVRINDRGPFVAGRIIDLSRGAARVIGMTAQGVARVMVEVLGR
jgi:rare lipoprotein A